MKRRLGIGTVSATMIVLVLAGCGGSEASPSAEAAASIAPATQAPVAPTTAPSVAPEATAVTSASTKLFSQCGGVGVRATPATDGGLLVRLKAGVKVRVVETVTGDAYTAGACGDSGDAWIKIDRIDGKSVKSLYGQRFGYAAAGFFK
jgi:hypothetical protein